jgi:hypothetical protein
LERGAVFGLFGDWLAEVERLTGDVVDGQGEVVRCEGTCDVGGKGGNLKVNHSFGVSIESFHL